MENIDKKQCIPVSDVPQEALDELQASIEAEIEKLGITVNK